LTNLHWLVTPACTTPKKKDTARSHGYWKDLLNILALATCNELGNIPNRATFLHNYTPPKNSNRKGRNHPYKKITLEDLKVIEDKKRARAKEMRKELHEQFYERMVKKLTNDPKYRALYILVARLFAEQLRHDYIALNELKTVDKKTDKVRYWQLRRSISLAGKWAPTPAGSHDRVTNISTAICQLLFSPSENVAPFTPLPSSAPYPIPDDRANCVTLRRFYAHWLLKTLREIIACPEPLMSSNRWTEIQYNHVPSKCMSLNKQRFILRDPEGFQNYLIDVQKGKRTLSGATMMPHELIAEAIRVNNALEMNASGKTKFPKLREFKKTTLEQEMQVIDAQWRSLVSRMKESGQMDNCMALCDVSGSMGSVHCFNKHRLEPIFPALGLSLMLASLTKPPFNAGFITFTNQPEFFRLGNMETMSLGEIVEKACNSPFELNTNFQAVFLDLLLPLAKQHRIAKEDMVKRLFVFSDMQFDAASGAGKSGAGEWETNHDLVEKAYKEAGYDVPEMVYWNLAGEMVGGRNTVEVLGERKGVAMMSGFSPAMMKVFMGEAEEEEEGWSEVTMEGEVVEKKKEEFTPFNIMKKALMKKSYDGLLVVD
jgi:hypothetical protein